MAHAVQQSVSGQQLRVVDRETPRRSWEFDIATGGTERQLMESALDVVRGRTVGAADVGESVVSGRAAGIGIHVRAADHRGPDFRPASWPCCAAAPAITSWWRSILWKTTGDLCQRHHQPLAGRHGAVSVPPGAHHRYAQPYARSSDVITSTLRFQSAEPCPGRHAAGGQYRGIPVLEARTNEASAPTAGPDRQLQIRMAMSARSRWMM